MKDGKAFDFSNMSNIESIGQQVLEQVSPDEINSFASNLDKLLPAMQQFGMPGAGAK